MKKLLVILTLLIFTGSTAFAELSNIGIKTFTEGNSFGLQDKDGNITVKPKYKKLIRLGTSSWIFQRHGRYGIMDSYGNILVEPKFRQVDRLLTKYVKFGTGITYGVYDEKGEVVLPQEYSSIDMLFGGMFLTCKNYKYGIADRNGKILLENKFDEIYMPKPHVIRLQYNGEWFEIEQVKGGEFTPPDDILSLMDENNFKITTLIKDPVTVSGYSAVTFTDYILKLISSISPAHEEAIDELMFSQGADTVSIFMRFSWLPMYPFVYLQKYYQAIRTPNNGPLSKVKDELKQKMN